MKWTWLVALIISLLVGSSSGQLQHQHPSENQLIWVPPSVALVSDRNPTVPHELVNSLKIGSISIVLERAKLEDMKHHFGGTIGVQGDASESLHWLCLTGKDKSGHWVLWLESGEIHGPSVGGFQLRSIPDDAKFDDRCQALPEAEVRLPNSLRLGMTESEAVGVLGKPTARGPGFLFYSHEHQETIRNEPYTSDNDVTLVLRNGVVCAFQVWKSTVS